LSNVQAAKLFEQMNALSKKLATLETTLGSGTLESPEEPDPTSIITDLLTQIVHNETRQHAILLGIQATLDLMLDHFESGAR
jgi:hypothetical protein